MSSDLLRIVQRLGISTSSVQPPRSKPKLSVASVDDSEADVELPPAPDDCIYEGLAGEFVKLVEPHTEADPVAVLVQTLVALGNVVGRRAHFRAEADRHYANLFACIVGKSSKGRKGTSWGHVRRLVADLDSVWADGCILSGLSSGEGLTFAVRDAIEQQQPVKEKGRIVGYETVVTDPGIDDKRLLVVESEFGGTLRVASRERNTLTAIMRQAWDTGTLRTLTKNSPTKATDSHISIIAHVTRDELRRLLTSNDTANGFANRFLWVFAQRSKYLPEGGDEVNLTPLIVQLHKVLDFVRTVGEMRRAEKARDVWAAVYPHLSDGKPGLAGEATGRSEAQVMRLALIFAVLDRSTKITDMHLVRALALWDYCEASARYVFGALLGDPLADTILAGLRSSPQGLTRSEIREQFGKHLPADRFGQALELLADHRLVRSDKEQTDGRPVERWFAAVDVGRKGRKGEKSPP